MVTLTPKFILTDIEGTTTSISFVADELFPYFREHIIELLSLKDHPVVAEAFAETVVEQRHCIDVLSTNRFGNRYPKEHLAVF